MGFFLLFGPPSTICFENNRVMFGSAASTVSDHRPAWKLHVLCAGRSRAESVVWRWPTSTAIAEVRITREKAAVIAGNASDCFLLTLAAASTRGPGKLSFCNRRYWPRAQQIGPPRLVSKALFATPTLPNGTNSETLRR